jgi:hypothetical protein
MWGKLQLAKPGDSPAAMFFNRPGFRHNWHSA